MSQFSSQFGKTCPRYYTYNADGLRVSSTLGKFITSHNWDPATRQILQDTAKKDTTGVIVSKNTYVYGLGLISVTDNNGNQRYVFPDGLGSVMTTISADASHTLVDQSYDVFGKPRISSPSDTFQFAGQQYDPIASANAGGLYYLRARYYDQSIGRFLTRDPIQLQLAPSAPAPGQPPAVNGPQPPSTDESAPRPGTPMADTNPQNLNAYSYVVNSPVNQTDPSGRCSFGLWSFCGMSTATAISLLLGPSHPSVTPTPTQTLGAYPNVWSCSTPCPSQPPHGTGRSNLVLP